MPPELQATWAFDSPAGPPCTSMLHTAPAAATALLLLALAGSQHTVQTIQMHTTTSTAVIVKTEDPDHSLTGSKPVYTTCISVASSFHGRASQCDTLRIGGHTTVAAASALVDLLYSRGYHKRLHRRHPAGTCARDARSSGVTGRLLQQIQCFGPATSGGPFSFAPRPDRLTALTRKRKLPA